MFPNNSIINPFLGLLGGLRPAQQPQKTAFLYEMDIVKVITIFVSTQPGLEEARISGCCRR
jgi:hypothetical protein